MIPQENLEHDSFRQPDSTESRVWKYMDFTRFVALLHTQSLYYCRVDCLDDSFEGCVGRSALPDFEEAVGKGPGSHGRMSTFVEMARKHFVNCWCMHEHESDAMWRIFGRDAGTGIAVRTTYSRLIDILPASDFIGLVTYLDYDTESFGLSNLFNYVMHKRTQFSYENEVRIVRSILDESMSRLVGDKIECNPPERGISVPVHIDLLVEDVVVSPYAPDWILKTVTAVAKRFGLSAPIRHSVLADSPYVGPREDE